MFTLSCKLSTLQALLNFYPALGQAHFHKIKGRETLSRSYNLNTTHNNTGLTTSLHQLSYVMCTWEFITFVFEISFVFYYVLSVLGQNHV
jgi:hypothetical protein